MVKNTLFFLFGFAISSGAVSALTRYAPWDQGEVCAAEIEEVDVDHPFVALRPPNAQRLVDDLFEGPTILVPLIEIEARVPRTRQRRPAQRRIKRRRVASLAPTPEPDLEAQEPLRDTLDRQSIASTMASMRQGVQQCYDVGMVPGSVVLRLAVYGETGRVAVATVDATSSTARCIRQLARQLRFPRFARTTLSIQYPYTLR